MFMFQWPKLPELALSMRDFKSFEMSFIDEPKVNVTAVSFNLALMLHEYTILLQYIYIRMLTQSQMHKRTHKNIHAHSSQTHTQQGAKNKAAFPPDVLEAYKYTFSQPGALTAPINYYRCLPHQPKPSQQPIELPVLVIWVST